MKKMMMIAAMMVATLTVSAQEAGQFFVKPMVGGTVSSIIGEGIGDAKMKIGIVAGAEAGYMISDKFGLTGGLLYTMQGAKVKDTDHNANLEYLNIPLLANYYVAPGLALKAGVQPGILTKAKMGDADYKDFFKSVDFSIPVGVSYEISDFVIDARYNFYPIKCNKSEHDGWEADGKARNSVFMLTLGYKIPF